MPASSDAWGEAAQSIGPDRADDAVIAFGRNGVIRSGIAGGGTVLAEERWRRLPDNARAIAGRRILATRWRAFGQETTEVEAEPDHDNHVVAIAMRPQSCHVSVQGRMVHDGLVPAGAFYVTEPGTHCRCVFRGPYDVLHLHVPDALILEYGTMSVGRSWPAIGAGAAMSRDPIVGRLGRALVELGEAGGQLGLLQADCICMAIVTRLFATGAAAAESKPAGLSTWRLRRVRNYVEKHLSGPITLADVAALVGLTPTHFATQFRLATGTPPHEFIVRRRIERAQDMLLDTRDSILEIALAVGFQTQSHFSSVFRRIVGQAPGAWRAAREPAHGRDMRVA